MAAESAIGLRSLRITFKDDEARNRDKAMRMFLEAGDLVNIRYVHYPEEEQVAALRLFLHPYEDIPRELLRDEIQRELERDRDHIKTYREQGLNPSLAWATGRIRTASLMQKAGLLGEEPLVLPPTPDFTTPNS